jgi:hypothetical protein
MALAPVVVAIVFLSGSMISRPQQLFWPAAPLLLLLATTIPAGAYSMWPNDKPKGNRAMAAAFYLGPLLVLPWREPSRMPGEVRSGVP